MHPPFYVVDHKVGPHAPLPHHERPHVRRGAPEPLRFSLPTPGSTHVRFAPAPLVAAPRAPAPEAAPEPAPKPGGSGGWLARLWRRPQRALA